MRAFDRVITARLLKPRKVDVCDKRGLKTAKVLTRYDNTQSDMMPSRCLVTHHWTFCIFLRATNLPRSPFRLCFFWMTWQLSFNEVMLQYSKFLTDISHIWQIIKSFKNVYIPRAFLSKCQTKGCWSEAQSFQPIFFTLLYTLVHLPLWTIIVYSANSPWIGDKATSTLGWLLKDCLKFVYHAWN